MYCPNCGNSNCLIIAAGKYVTTFQCDSPNLPKTSSCGRKYQIVDITALGPQEYPFKDK